MVGYRAKNKNVLDEKFICPVCSLIINEPVQFTKCGHRQCQSCFDIQSGTTIHCPECLTETQREQVMIDRGFKRDMQSLPIECSFCQWIDVLSKYQEHLDREHPNPKCEYCDQQFDSVKNLNQHIVSQCQNVPVKCLLENFSCEEQIVRSSLSNHYSSEEHEHLLRKVLCQVKSPMKNARKSSAQVNNEVLESITVTAVNLDVSLFQELCEMRNIPSGDMDISSDNRQQRLNNALLQCQNKFPTLTFDFLKVKLSLQEDNSTLVGPTVKKDIIKKDLTLSNKKADNWKYVSYDGTFIWKIKNITEKMVDAQSERQTSIYSPPFYSSSVGYKMRLRLHPDGDGNARRTHMSLFFVLMRGLNDAILEFPFKYKVVFCLYDQTPAQRHIIDSFRPDIKSNSFQRPRSEMNIASGIAKFLPLEMIEQEVNAYVRDDAMFIKVMIDFGDMPKTLLPYALSINPGLPANVQQAMIKKEAERRVQQQHHGSS